MRGYFLHILFCCLLFIAFPAAAQTNIAVVDVKRILSHSEAALSIKSQQDALREKFLG